uniref:Kunitz/Bovine pancreatic trypsin inhibitor domain protein n=1 Tax=Heterorhabditis bacteriophora TaxID=37862 RepID=A0A1I7X306_HETBA
MLSQTFDVHVEETAYCSDYGTPARLRHKESSPITVATTTAIPSRRANIRTTQGIRITPKGQHLREETTEVTTPITSTTSQKPVPVVHIHQVTRTPPVPETALLEGSEETADSVNRCLHPKDPGNCRGQFIRWYWDNDRKVCDVFTYSGCQGNGNNYASREECLAICHKEAAPIVVADFSNVCKQDVDAGECNGVFQRFAFDTDSGECRSFTYGGCGGNGNNFATITECRNKCQKVAQSPGNLCEHEIETGECSGVFVRYGYDKTVNDCRQFTYGGCGGNGNNFATVQECRNVCVKKVCNPNPQCDLARCQIVNDRNGCPFCSCPPVKQPLPPDSEKPHCPIIDVDKCKEPCILINNRKGCQDCVCPALANSIVPPVNIGLPPAPHIQTGHSPSSKTLGTFVSELSERKSSVATRPIISVDGPSSPGTAGPPSSPSFVGPPSGRTAIAPPAPSVSLVSSPISLLPVKAFPSVKQESIDTLQVNQFDIDAKQILPPPFTAQLQEKCMQPVEPGPCKHFVDRWFFNSDDGTCHPFKYGGCAGNRNHFFTQKECEIHCARFLHSAPNELHVHAPIQGMADLDLSPAITHHNVVPHFEHSNVLDHLVEQTSNHQTNPNTLTFSPTTSHYQDFSLLQQTNLTNMTSSQRRRITGQIEYMQNPIATLPKFSSVAPSNDELLPFRKSTNDKLELKSEGQWSSEEHSLSTIPSQSHGKDEETIHTEVSAFSLKENQISSIKIFVKPLERQDIISKESRENLTDMKMSLPQSEKYTDLSGLNITQEDKADLPKHQESINSSNFKKYYGKQYLQHNLTIAKNDDITEDHPEKELTNENTTKKLQKGNNLISPRLVLDSTTTTDPLPPKKNLILSMPYMRHSPRQESVLVEEVDTPIELHVSAIEHSTPIHQIYGMNTIKEYNPQMNPNLSGLSPPVDPTYFTYNSQNLGGSPKKLLSAKRLTFKNISMKEENTNTQTNNVVQPNIGLQHNNRQRIQEDSFHPQFSSNQVPSDKSKPVISGVQQHSVGVQHGDRQGIQEGSFHPQFSSIQIPSNKSRPLISGVQQHSVGVQHGDRQGIQEGSFHPQFSSNQIPLGNTNALSNGVQQHNVGVQHGDRQGIQEGSFHPQFSSNQIPFEFSKLITNVLEQKSAKWKQSSDVILNSQLISAHNNPFNRILSQSNEQLDVKEKYLKANAEENYPNKKLISIKKNPSLEVEIQPSQEIAKIDEKNNAKLEYFFTSQPSFTLARFEVDDTTTFSPKHNEVTKTKDYIGRKPSQGYTYPESKYEQKQFIFFEGYNYTPTTTAPIDSVDGTVMVEPKLYGPLIDTLNEFRERSHAFQSAAKTAFQSVGQAVSNRNDSTFLMEQEFIRNVPVLLTPNAKSRKLEELPEEIDNDLPMFLRPPPPNRTLLQPAHTLNHPSTLYNIPPDNFPTQMQKVNQSITDIFPNLLEPAANLLSKNPNFQSIRAITGILPEDEDKELVDETPTPSRSVVVAGVTQVHINEPLTVENYNSPNPPLRADKDDSSYGETILHTHAISNAMSTTVISTKSNDLNELKEVEVKDESSSSTSFKIPLSTQFFVENTDITRKTVMNASTISVTPSPLITNEPSTTAFVSTESITNATTSITPILSTELPVKSTSSSVDYAVNPTVTTTQDNQLNYVKSTFSITKQESVEQVTNVMGENTNEDFATTITTTTPTKTEVEPSTTITNEIESIEDESEEFTPSTNSKEISSLSEVTNIPSQEVQVRNIMTSSKFHTENVLKETEEKVVDEKVEFFNRSSIQPPSSENEYKPISVSKPISEKIHQTNSATLKKIVIAGKTKSPITSTLVTENATTPSSTITTTTTTTTLHFVPSTTVETNEITRHSDAKSERLPEVNAAGVSLFEPKEPEKILKPDIFAVKHVGREPVPSEAVGIGRNMASLDIDNLDEPTTIIPITTTTERLRNTTYNRASTSTPYKSSSTSISPRPESITQGNEVIERAKTAQPSNPTHAENVADPSTHTLRADSYDPRIICAMPPDAGTCFNYVPRWHIEQLVNLNVFKVNFGDIYVFIAKLNS